MRKRKVTNTVLGVIGILIIAALLLVPATQARAKSEKVEGRAIADSTLTGFFARPNHSGIYHFLGKVRVPVKLTMTSLLVSSAV